MRPVFPIANGLMLALFLLGAAVQWNDPDPIPWVAVYGAATVLAGLAFRTRRLAWPAALLGLGALVWAGTLMSAILRAPLGDVVGHVEMKTQDVEEAREALGLFLIAAWCAVLAARSRRPAA